MKILALLMVLMIVPTVAEAQTLLVDCGWTAYCVGGSTLVHEGDCDVYGDAYIIYDNFTCPDGCVTGAGQYGADCRFNETQCYNQQLGDLSFSSHFNWGVGGMMMLIGVGIILETYTRGQDKKRKDMFGQLEP